MIGQETYSWVASGFVGRSGAITGTFARSKLDFGHNKHGSRVAWSGFKIRRVRFHLLWILLHLLHRPYGTISAI